MSNEDAKRTRVSMAETEESKKLWDAFRKGTAVRVVWVDSSIVEGTLAQDLVRGGRIRLEGKEPTFPQGGFILKLSTINTPDEWSEIWKGQVLLKEGSRYFIAHYASTPDSTMEAGRVWIELPAV